MFDFNVMSIMIYIVMVKYIFGLKWSWENENKPKPKKLNKPVSRPAGIVKNVSNNEPLFQVEYLTDTKAYVLDSPKSTKKPRARKGKLNNGS